jgi:membrane fusion protein (multidrug efflux system)
MTTKYIPLILTIVISACTSQPANDVDAKKAELETAKKELAELKAKISDLEKEISLKDSTFLKNTNSVLIAPVKIDRKPFEHYIEVRGSVASRRNVALSAQTGGEIERVYVREGQRVTKGQTLVSLNADVLRNTLAELKSSYELAKTIYEKQEKLWNQKIGTEVQYLQAKNNKQSLENRIAATNAQLAQMVISAPFSGTVDKVDALEGEMAAPGIPLVRMVNSDDLYIKADVSEEFAGKFKQNDKVEVYLTSLDKKVSTTISAVGQVINPENRTFEIEVKLTPGLAVHPNQVTVLTLRDYVSTNSFSVPTKLIQRDNQGQYVYIVETKGGATVARKAYVRPGISYSGNTEILEGLTGDETIVGEGFRDVTDGAEITVAKSEEPITAVAKN